MPIDRLLTVTGQPRETLEEFKGRVAELQRIAATYTDDKNRQAAMVEAYLGGEFQGQAARERREVIDFLRDNHDDLRTPG